MNNIKFYGYLDNEVIVNGFLIPVYSENKKYFFHELSKDNKYIIGFREFDLESYSRDSIVEINKPLPAKIDNESYIVVKFNDTVRFGTFSEIVDLVSRRIFDGEIKSKILIDNAKKIFGETFFKRELLEEAIKLLTSLKGISKRSLNKRLSEYSIPKLVKVASGDDNKFENYFEDLILNKNNRILRVPANVDILVQGDNDIIFTSHHHGTHYHANLEDISIIRAVPVLTAAEIQHHNVWKIKKEGAKVFTGYCIYANQNIGIEMARLSSQLNEKFADTK